MAYTLTSHYDRVIDQLIRAGHFGNRSEVVRAGLRKLEQEYLGADYSASAAPPAGHARTLLSAPDQNRARRGTPGCQGFA